MGRTNNLVLLAAFLIAEAVCTGQMPGGESTVPYADNTLSLRFDVVSIRETEPAVSYSQYVSDPPRIGKYDGVAIWTSQIIGQAFGVNYRYQLSGGPEWVRQQRFTVHAKSDRSNDDGLASLTIDQARLEKQSMLRALLADRFGLRSHIEVRTGPVYFLTFAKSSPNLHKADDSDEGGQTSGIRSSGNPGDIELKGSRATMKQLSGLMSYYLKSEVIDQTGLTQSYDFDVHFNARQDGQADTQDDADPAEVAFRDQIGLKLTRGNGPIRMIVIDTITKPSAN